VDVKEASHADEEATRIAKGHVVAAASEARASDVIQKVECPLKPDFEYTIRGEKQSMINQNEDPYK
jgi:hypothetical protein